MAAYYNRLADAKERSASTTEIVTGPGSDGPTTFTKQTTPVPARPPEGANQNAEDTDQLRFTDDARI
jgi:hypothetical protein